MIRASFRIARSAGSNMGRITPVSIFVISALQFIDGQMPGADRQERLRMFSQVSWAPAILPTDEQEICVSLNLSQTERRSGWKPFSALQSYSS